MTGGDTIRRTHWLAPIGIRPLRKGSRLVRAPAPDPARSSGEGEPPVERDVSTPAKGSQARQSRVRTAPPLQQGSVNSGATSSARAPGRQEGLGHFATSLEDGKIPAFRNRDDDRLVLPLVGEVVLQFHPQQPSLRPDNVVFVWVVTGRSIIHADRDLLFGCRFRLVVEGAPADVEEECPQPRRLLKGAAGGDARATSSSRSPPMTVPDTLETFIRASAGLMSQPSSSLKTRNATNSEEPCEVETAREAPCIPGQLTV